MRRSRWTRSSGCCWRPPGRRSSGPGSTRPRCESAKVGVFVGRRWTRRTSAWRGPSDLEGYLMTGQAQQRRVRPGLLHARLRGPGGHRGHRLLLVAGGAAPRRAVAAQRRVVARPGRRGDGDGDAGRVRRLLPAARPGAGRPVQVVRRRRPTARLVGGRRGCSWWSGCPTRGGNGHRVLAVLRGHGGQPGRRVQRPDRAERPVPAAGDPAGARRRPARLGRRGRGRGARHRHPARRPDRGAGAAGDLRRRRAGGSRCGWAR